MAVKSRKNTINRVLNLALYLLMCFLIGTGLLLWLRLGPGTAHVGRRSGREPLTVLGMHRHDWGDLHLYAGLAFVAVGLAHLYLNKTWLVKIAASNRAWRLWLGLAAGVAIPVVLLVLPTNK